MLSGLGFTGYYLASFLDFAGLAYITASLERLILYLNPTLVLLLGLVLFQAQQARRAQAFAHWPSAMPACCWCSATRSRCRQGRHFALGAALVFASAVSYAVYLVYSGEEVKRLGALRLTGLATSVACLLCIAQFLVLRPLSARLRWRPR